MHRTPKANKILLLSCVHPFQAEGTELKADAVVLNSVSYLSHSRDIAVTLPMQSSFLLSILSVIETSLTYYPHPHYAYMAQH